MTSPLRVVLNANILLAPIAGIGQYVSELSRALQLRDDVQLSFAHGLHHGKELPVQSLRHYSLLRDLVKRVLPAPYQAKRWIERRTLNRALNEQNAQLYHEPSLWPQRVTRPMVFTLHDLTHVHYPQTQPADRLRAIERNLGYALEHSRQILCVSRFTAQQVIQHYGINPKKIHVTPLGVSKDFRPWSAEQATPLLEGLGLKYRRYLLCVGTLEPRKNLELVFQAIRSLPGSLLEECPLVLCGAYGWGDLPESMAALLAKRHVIHLGYRSAPELRTLLGGASMLLFPSLYEGFGLPILEAMASGTPVITSNCASMPEVGGSAAHYIDPNDSVDLATAIERLHEDREYWQLLRKRGLLQAQQFTWAHTAELTAAAYHQALDGTV